MSLPGKPEAQALAASRGGAVLLDFPSRRGPLLPSLHALHDSLAPGARAVVVDVVWQTAPTPQLAAALAPPPGAEKVRPVEGYEMQLEHAGFDILERHDPPGLRAWLAERGAADERGAARVVAWLVARSTERPEP